MSIAKINKGVAQSHTRFAAAASRLPTAILELERLRPGPEYVVSCYVCLDRGERERGQYLRRLKGAVAQAELAVARLAADQRRQIGRDLRRILRAVENPARLPGVPGLAIFSSEPHQLFLRVPLPQVYHTRIVVDHSPQLRELLALEADFGRLLLAAFDRKVARFFAITAFEVQELPCLYDPSTRGGRFRSVRGDSPGWGERAFHHRIEEERHRHFTAIGVRLAELDRKDPVSGVILAGPLEETHAAARLLPAGLAARFMGEVRLNPTALRPAAVRDAALQVRRAFQARRERERIAALEEKIGAGWGSSGPQDTLRALARGQVRTLFIGPELTGAGYRCAGSGRLALSKAACRGEGDPEPVQDLVNEAIEEALRQRVEVAVIHDPAIAQAIDGLAAEFRFRQVNP